MATRSIYLVRHGEYDWNHQPSPLKGLTPLGVQQARFTAQRLRSVTATAIYSSDLMRAIETAEIIGGVLEGVPYEKDSGLRECYLASPTLSDVPLELIQAGEKQAASAFSKYLCPTREGEKNEIIVSHGNLIRYLASRVLGGSPDSWSRMRTFNCGITQIAVESDGRLWLVSYNDVGHLPAEFITAGMPQRSNKAQQIGSSANCDRKSQQIL
jgi:serine/threonine-protein phosphatase PGAM5